MRIKIIHLSDLELNPTLQATPDSGPWLALQEQLRMTPNFRMDTWNWLFDNTIDLLDRIKENKAEDEHQILLISGDVVKGYGTRNQWVMDGWDRLYGKLKEMDASGTQIILTTGSHDYRAIEENYPFEQFYHSKPYNNHEGDPSAPWIVITNPGGERLDLCDNELSVIGYGDLDGVRGEINRAPYDAGLAAFAQTREDLVPRFVIGMSPDHRPRPRQWAAYNIYNYIATGGAEGHDIHEHQFLIRENDYFVYSKQGRPYRCVGFGDPMWDRTVCSFTYGIINTENRTATFKDLPSNTPTDEFTVEGGHSISYEGV